MLYVAQIMSIIDYDEICKLPSRRDYINPTESTEIDTAINTGQPIEFIPTTIEECKLQDQQYQTGKYKVSLAGILKDGRKVNVIIDGITPYFEIKLDKDQNTTLEEINSLATELLEELNETQYFECNYHKYKPPISHKITHGRPFKLYQVYQSTYLAVYFSNLKDRELAINYIRLRRNELIGKPTLETAHDDLNNYYRVVCRDYLTTFSSWTLLENYKYYRSTPCKTCSSINTSEPQYGTHYKNTEKKLVNMTHCEKHADASMQTLRFRGGDCIRVDISNYRPIKDVPTSMLKDKTISLCWDIETYSSSGNLPTPNNKNDCIFCISMTFQFVNEQEPFAQYCLCDVPAGANPTYTTIICHNEVNLIKCFSKLIEKIRPEFIFGFNDSDYDWNWLVQRASQTKGLLTYMAKRMDCNIPYFAVTDEIVLKNKYRKSRIKLEAKIEVTGCALEFFGYIPVDVRTVFRKLYPTAEETSLKYFLKQNKLGGKEDMEIQRLFKIYYDAKQALSKSSTMPEQLLLDMAEVNKYCVVDAKRCHDLLKIRNVITDNRELADMSYCSLRDSFYNANGMRVCNLVIAIGQTSIFNIHFSNINKYVELTGKYPGAYVFPPKKGLHTSKLSITERITRDKEMGGPWANTTPDEILQYYEVIKEVGINVHDTSILDDAVTRLNASRDKPITLPKHVKAFFTESARKPGSEHLATCASTLPITGLDFSSLYPSLIRCYNFTPEYCILDYQFLKQQAELEIQEDISLEEKIAKFATHVKFPYGGGNRFAEGWFVRHHNHINPTDPKFRFGVYPYILDDMFNKRVEVKKYMKKYNHQKESIEAMPPAEQQKHAEDYANAIFMRTYYNSKQNAIKLLMNTVYGVTGSNTSAFFVVEVAGAITQYGQLNIKLAKQVVESAGCEVHYGDTDSLYISLADSTYRDLHISYYTGQCTKLEYWTKLVERTFVEINPIRDKVNQTFFEDNGTKFLSMAYEEVMFPTALLAKKKYFGIPHENIANFNPKDLFIRGLEIKKRGVSDMLRKICSEIMWRCMSVDNIYSIIELVHRKIDAIYTVNEWVLDDFLQSGVYRPNKNNVKLRTLYENLMARAAKEGKECEIKPNERFDYVIVKRYPYKYDLFGRKKEISMGDRLDLKTEVLNGRAEIDIDHYMKSSINGQLARLITYESIFASATDDEKKTYSLACAYIENYCSKYYTRYNDVGKLHKQLYKQINNLIDERAMKQAPEVITCHNIDMKIYKALDDDLTFEDSHVEYANAEAIKLLQYDFCIDTSTYVKRKLGRRVGKDMSWYIDKCQEDFIQLAKSSVGYKRLEKATANKKDPKLEAYVRDFMTKQQLIYYSDTKGKTTIKSLTRATVLEKRICAINKLRALANKSSELSAKYFAMLEQIKEEYTIICGIDKLERPNCDLTNVEEIDKTNYPEFCKKYDDALAEYFADEELYAISVQRVQAIKELMAISLLEHRINYKIKALKQYRDSITKIPLPKEPDNIKEIQKESEAYTSCNISDIDGLMPI